MTISLQLIRETPRWERDMITVSLGEVFGDDKYPWMTLTMSLDKYNEFNTPMPRFLIGQQYDIIIRSWEDGCECDEDFSEHDWNKKTCAMEEPGVTIHDATTVLNMYGPDGRWAIITNNGRQDITSAEISLPEGKHLNVSLEPFGAAALPIDLRITQTQLH